MSDNEAKIAIVANASGVAPGVDQAKAAIQGLSESAAIATASMRGSFASVSTSVTELGVTIRESVGVFGEMREAVMAFGEAMLAAFAVEKIVDFASEMAEVGADAVHTAAEIGMTVEQVTALNYAAGAMGVSSESASMSYMRLARSVSLAAEGSKQQKAAFDALGISVKDGNGKLKDLDTVLGEVANAFAAHTDGIQKTTIAMDLMGRGGARMIPLLDQGSEGLAKMREQAEAAGVVLSGKMADGMEVTAQKFHQMKEATEGLAITLFEELEPAIDGILSYLIQLTENINEALKPGSEFRDVMGELSKAAVVLGAGLTTYVIAPMVATALAAAGASEAFVAMTAAMAAGGGAVGAVTEFMYFLEAGIVGATEAALAFTAALLANPFVWVAAAVAGLVALYEEWTGKTREQTQASDDLKAANDDLAGAEDELRGKSLDALNAMKAEKEEALSLAEAHLKAAESALAQAQAEATIAQNAGKDGDIISFVEHGMGLEGVFDQNKVDKQTQAVNDQKKAVAEIQAMIADINKSISTGGAPALANPDTATHKKAKKEKATPGDKDNSAQTDLEEAKDDAKAKEAIAIDNARTIEEMAKLSAEEQLAAVDKAEKSGVITKKQATAEKVAILAGEVQAEITAANAIYQAKVTEIKAEEAADVASLLAKQAALDKSDKDYITKFTNLQNQIQAAQIKTDNQLLVLANAHENQLTTIKTKGVADREKAIAAGAQNENKVWQQSVDQFSMGLAKMATGQRTFMQELNAGWTGMLNVVDKVISQMITQWIEGLLVKEGVSKAADQKDTLRDAAAAARGAYKAMIGIPIIGPILAPAAAAVAFAAVEGFSAAGGWDDVPFDGAQTTLHKNEMVLPATLATPLRAMLTSNSGSNDNPPAAPGSGSAPIHIHATDAQSFQRLLSTEEGQNGIRTALQKGRAGLKF